MVLGRRMRRRLVIAGLAATLAAPVAVIQPAAAAILFTCDSVTGSAVFSPGLVHDPRAQSLSSGSTAPSGPADITHAATTDTGADPAFGGDSLGASLSADGTIVAFTSRALLDPADTRHPEDAYVKNLSTGDIVLASSSDTGASGRISSFSGTLSADGAKLALSSSDNTLDPADTDILSDVYVKNLQNGNITLVSTSDGGIKGNDRSTGGTMFADGRGVAFSSRSTNFDPADTDTLADAYVKNLRTGDTSLISTTALGVKGNRDVWSLGPSADGTKVVLITASSNWDPSDTDARDDVYVKDLITGDLTLVSTSDTGVKGNGESDSAGISGDGTKVVFHSNADNLDPADTDSFYDVYVKDLTTADMTLVSTSDTGTKGDWDSRWPSVSSDGTTVAFTSRASNLDLGHVPRTDFLSDDVYVKDLDSGDLTLASTSDTGVGGDRDSSFPSLSADGAVVGFHSGATNLEPPQDTTDYYDVFVKELPAAPTSVNIAGCSNGNSGTASIVDIRSYGSRPLGCATSLGGAAGNDYADTTPILVGAAMSMTIDWASGPNSYGVAAAKAGPTGTQWRFRLAITASPGHDTPATNQYLPAAGSGFTKTRLQGKLDWSALDSFNCTSGIDDPLSWVNLANNGTWVAKTG